MPAKPLFNRKSLLLSCVLISVYLFVACYYDSIPGLEHLGNKMRMFISAQAARAALGVLGVWAGWGGVGVEGQFSAPMGVDTWCGKAYRAT